MKLFTNKKYALKKETKKRIEKEIDMFLSLNSNIMIKVKEYELGYYISFIIDKQLIKLNENESDNPTIPDFITFLTIFDCSYPDQRPKIVSKTNFYAPNLMNGKDLSEEALLTWRSKMTLKDIANGLLIFLKTILNAKEYRHYGKYHIGAIYDLRNFHNMLVSSFNCQFDLSIFENEYFPQAYQQQQNDYTLILSDDSFVLFQNYENDPSIGKIIFWATLHSILEIKLNKLSKVVKIRLLGDNDPHEKQLRLKMTNVAFFREALIKRMSDLKIRIFKGLKEKRLTLPEIHSMSIKELKENIDIFEKKILNKKTTFYNVDTFSILCSRAIEYYSSIDSDKYLEVISKMKVIFDRDDVKNCMKDHRENKAI